MPIARAMPSNHRFTKPARDLMLLHMSDNSPHEKNLFRVMVIGTCLSFGLLGAIAASMKDFIHGNAAFEFSLRTIIGFVVGFVLGWLFWKVLRTRLPR